MKKIVLLLVLIYSHISGFAQQFVHYSFFEELPKNDTIQNLSVSLEDEYSILKFNEIDFSEFKQLKSLKIQGDFYESLYSYNEETEEKILINEITLQNESLLKLNIESLEWEFELGNNVKTKILFGDAFENLPVSTFTIFLTNQKINFPPFVKHLKHLKQVVVRGESQNGLISLENINPENIESLSFYDIGVAPKSLNKLYKFSNLIKLAFNEDFKHLDVSKFKKLESLEFTFYSLKQLKNCFQLNQLKTLKIIASGHFYEELNLEGIQSLQKLESIQILYTDIEIEELCKLSKIESLKEIRVASYYQKNDINACSEWLKGIMFIN